MRKTSIPLLWVLNLFDAIMTWFAVAVGQYAREANPTMLWAIEKGWAWFFIIKIGLISLVSLGAYYISENKEYGEGRFSMKAVLWVMVAVYVAVAAWHIYGLVIWHVLK